MKQMRALLILGAILCSPLVLSARAYRSTADSTLDELRLEVADLKHELKSALVDLNILDERVRKQNVQPAKQDPNQLAALERRVAGLEKLLEKAVADLRTLNTTTTQALAKIQDFEREIASHDQRLSEVNQLKGTLTSISKAIGGNSSPSEALYRVKAGDSLEKIARAHKISVDALKQLNQLQSDKIIIGQELKIR